MSIKNELKEIYKNNATITIIQQNLASGKRRKDDTRYYLYKIIRTFSVQWCNKWNKHVVCTITNGKIFILKQTRSSNDVRC